MSTDFRPTRAMLRIALLGLTVGWLAACDEEGPAEKAGEAIDNAVEDAGDAVEDAGDAIEDTADDATSQ
ncbi:MAG: hypothetical protein CMM50_12570 [Rhodospirillaceae bacterium]|nr:hypothetical protein [Rhodospirillaceae bacterium]